MSTDRETTRAIRSWLEEGVTVLPDRVLDTVLDRLPATPQRRRPAPAWRFADMNRSLQAGLGAAAAVVVVAVIGLNLIGGPSSGGGPRPSHSPKAAPPASPIPTASLLALPIGDSPQALAAGSYLTAAPFRVTVGFTIPASWKGNVGGPNHIGLERTPPNTGAVYFEVLGNTFADPCRPGETLSSPALGSSVADLVDALTHIPQVSATTPVSTTFAGYPATEFTLTASLDVANCTGGTIRLYELPLGGIAAMEPGERDTFRILTVGTTRLVVGVVEPAQGSLGAADVEAILGSVTLAP